MVVRCPSISGLIRNDVGLMELGSTVHLIYEPRRATASFCKGSRDKATPSDPRGHVMASE